MARRNAPRPFGAKADASQSGSSGGQGITPTGKAASRNKALGAARTGARSSSATGSRRGAAANGGAAASQVIPTTVANRMARRVAIATGIPTVLGMSVFVISYLLVSRRILDIPPSATLLASGSFFLAGLVGLSYGVVSASWDDAAGSLLGFEQIGINLSRIRGSLRAMRQGSPSGDSSDT